jgi:hypothetical protein
MGIDVAAETTIRRPVEEVASFAMSVEHDKEWIGGVKHVRQLTPPPITTGTRVSREVSLLGRRIVYVLEVIGYDPPWRLELRSVKAPFPMHVIYEFAPAPVADVTRARIRLQGEAVGFYKVAAPLVATAVRRSLRADLDRLKRLLERASSAF